MQYFNSILRGFWQEEDGQDMVEYALLLSFCALISLGVLHQIKFNIAGWWTRMDTTLASAS